MRPKVVIAEPNGFPGPAQARLAAIADVVAGPFTRAGLGEALGDADAVIVRLAHRIDRDLLRGAGNLRFVASATTGHTHIDLDHLKERGIRLLSLKGEIEFLRGITATAELTWGLLLALGRRLPDIAADIADGIWDRDRVRGMQLSGLTLGILGFGRLGAIIAEYARAFRMNVLACDPFVREFPEGVTPVDFDTLFRTADAVTLHLPEDGSTRNLVDGRAIALMKPTAFLINTSRGEIVDEAALLDALAAGRIAGAALDVVADEGEPGAGWLRGRDVWRQAMRSGNLILTPHVGGATADSMARAETFIADKLCRAMAGEDA